MKEYCATSDDGSVGGLKATLECVIATYEEELAILRRERDLAESAARHEAGEATHWRKNHADMVARCAMLRERDDLPVDRIPAYEALMMMQDYTRKALEELHDARIRIEGFEEQEAMHDAADQEIISILRRADLGSCTCMTKTPEPKYHAENCRHRLIMEAISALTVTP